MFALLTISLILIGAFVSVFLLGAMIGSSFYHRPKLKPPATLPKPPQRKERPLVLT
jgi:hypothetical protein